MIELQAELSKLIIENKMAIVIGLQFLIHKAASYYVKPGAKSFKGFVKFLIGKIDADKP